MVKSLYVEKKLEQVILFARSFDGDRAGKAF